MSDPRVLGALAALCCTVAGAAAAQDTEAGLAAFTGTYTVEWRGLTAGISTLELVHIGGNDYSYRSSNMARGLFKLAFPDAITQVSEFSLVNGVVRPSVYRADDGSSDPKRSISLHFDWSLMRVTGTAEGKPVNQPLKPNTQDGLSVQIELMRELVAGRSPQRFWLISKDEVNDYEYTREGKATLDTPLGKLDTVIYRSQHPGSSRVTRLWFAPSLGYLPVRAQQARHDKAEFTLSIRELKRN